MRFMNNFYHVFHAWQVSYTAIERKVVFMTNSDKKRIIYEVSGVIFSAAVHC